MPSVGTQFVIYAFSGSDSHFCHSASALGRATKYFEELTLRNLVPATAGDLSNGRTAAAGNQQQLEPLLPIQATSNMTAKRLATRLLQKGTETGQELYLSVICSCRSSPERSPVWSSRVSGSGRGSSSSTRLRCIIQIPHGTQ